MAPRINIPPLTRSTLLALVALTVLNGVVYSDRLLDSNGEQLVTRVGNGAPYLSIVPGASIKYPWVFLTATLVEQNIVGLLITGLTLFYGGRYLERAWGSKEYAKSMLFISMIPNILTFGVYVLWFALTKHESALYVKRKLPSSTPRY